MALPGLEESLRRALAHHQAGQLTLAEQIYREVLSTDQNCAFAWYLLGALLNQRGEAGAGLECINKSIQLGLKTPEVFNHLGECYRNLERYEDAINCYQTSIKMNPQQADAMANLGSVLNMLGKFEDALPILERAVALRPDLIEARFQNGIALEKTRRVDQAIRQWELTLQIQPGHLGALSHLGITLQQQGEIDRALVVLGELVQRYPNYAEGHSNYAIALGFCGEFERAVRSAQQAIALAPNRAEAYRASSTVFISAKRYTEALQAIDRAIELDPDDRMARFTRSVILLHLGKYLEGFEQYDWREPHQTFEWIVQKVKGKVWNPGDRVSGRLLVHGEQGFGDLIQFARYIRLLTHMGVKADLLVWHEIRPLMRSLDGISQVESPNTVDFEDYELHFPLLSLPRVFKTTLETIPHQVPYLHANDKYVERWKGVIEAHGSGVRVGIIWAGNSTPDPLRSCSMKYIAALAGVRGVSWYSLQVGEHRSQLKDAPAAMNILDLGEKFGDFAETTALIEQKKLPGPPPVNRDFADTGAAMSLMDLIITIDTSAAHLAGAMGLKTWVMLPFAPDWRWMSEGESTPWYPTMRLFRQVRPRDWTPVIEKIRESLLALVGPV